MRDRVVEGRKTSDNCPLRPGATQRGRFTVSVCVKCTADRERVYGLLSNGVSWPEWGMFTGYALERSGWNSSEGVGAVRRLSTRLTHTREQLTALEPGRRMAYKLLSGLPLVDYSAEVVLHRAVGGGTLISWTASFGPQFPGTAWFWRLFVKQVIGQTARDLAKAASAG